MVKVKQFRVSDVAAIILAALPFMWLNQYNLMHSTVPGSLSALFADVENIEHRAHHAGAPRQKTAVEG
jgi:hypothetical protein